jgi:hypothetical protein
MRMSELDVNQQPVPPKPVANAEVVLTPFDRDKVYRLVVLNFRHAAGEARRQSQQCIGPPGQGFLSNEIRAARGESAWPKWCIFFT